MNVSLRSQMTAGIAALGAAVVAVTPITQPDLLPSAQRVAAAVELSGFSNPIIAITDNIFFATQYILDQGLYGDAIWPDSFYGTEFLYAPLNVGLIPDLVNQFSFGPLNGLINNLGGYGFAGIASALYLVDGVADSAFNAPFAVVDAVQELIAGDPQAALQALVTGIVEPLQVAVDDALFNVGYILDNIIQNVQTVVTSTLPYLVAAVVDASVANVTFIVESLVDTAASFVGNLAALNIEGAWNDIVDGILGSGGTLGQIVELTFGIGLGEFNEQDEFVVNYPSIRSVLTSELQRLGGQKSLGDGGITNDPLFGFAEAAAAVTEPAPAAAVEVSAPAVALESAPAVVETPAAPEAVVEAPAPVREPAVSAEVADVTPVVQAEAPAPVGESDVTSEVSVVTEADAAPSPAAAPSEAQAGDSDGAAAKTPKRAHRGAKSARGAN
jgi:hypothetical protein